MGMKSEEADTYARVVSTISGIISKRLGDIEVSENTNFFEAGGDSLMTVDVAEAISRHYNVEFSLIEIFENPTPAALGQSLVRNYLVENVDGKYLV